MKPSLFIQITIALLAFLITTTEPGRTKRVAGRVTLAQPGQFPHAVFLIWYWNVKPIRQITRFKCTSNLLSPNFVVTAAHCYYHLLYTYRNYSSMYDFVRNLTKKQGHSYTRAGSVDGFGKERGWQDRQGEKLFIPAAYTRPSTMFDMDVALVYLPVAYTLNIPHLSHVALARVSEVPAFDDYRDCVAAGFGYVNANEMQLVIRPDYKYGSKSVQKNKLHFYKVKFALNNFCKYLQKQLDGKLIYFDEFYGCARSIGTIKNYTYAQSCFGDGGGPLMCNGLLTAINVQRRENKPCDFYSSDTAFTMFTLLGAPEVEEWLRKRVEFPPLVPLPPWDPWDVASPPLDESRVRDGGVEDGVMGDGDVREAGKKGSVEVRLEAKLGNVGKGLEQGIVGVGREMEDLTVNVELTMGDKVGDVGYEIAGNGGRKIDDKEEKKGKIKDDYMQADEKDGVKEEEVATEGVNPNVQKQVNLESGPPKDQSGEKVLNGGRRKRKPRRVVDLKSEEANSRRGRIRRNVNGGLVDGDVRDDDPDLVKLLTLIRGESDEGDAVRRKRQEEKWRPREEMAKELVRATRDLDPGALHRFGMGADVFTRDNVGEDPWAMEVWNEVYEDDKV